MSVEDEDYSAMLFTISSEIDPNSPWKKVVPGAASLLEHINKRIFVWLRDSRMYVGYLRSVDQFANLVMNDAAERVQIGNHYGDIPQGVMLVRGENVALLGEIGDDSGDKHSTEELIKAQVKKDKTLKELNVRKDRAYWKRGHIHCSEDYF